MKSTRNCRKCRTNVQISDLNKIGDRWFCTDEAKCESNKEVKRQSKALDEVAILGQLQEAVQEVVDFTVDDVIEAVMVAKEDAVANSFKQKYNESLKVIQDQANTIKLMQATKTSPRLIKVNNAVGHKSTATAILQLSDLHIGSIIDPDYVKGAGYSPKQSAEFLNTITEVTSTFIEERSSSVPVDEIVVLLGGDLIEALDHGQNQLEVADQVILCQDILQDTFMKLKKLNIPIRCIVVSGNHDRLTRYKRVPTTNRTRRSFDWIIANNLQRWNPDIPFTIEEGYVAEFHVKGKDVILHHGDAIRGGSGVGGIAPSLMKWHYRRNQIKRYDYAFMGHFHTHMVVNGNIFVNGGLPGDSGYTLQLGLKSDRSQNLVFVDSLYGYNSIHRLAL